MPWWCKNEYREGTEVCEDCGCELVDEEPAERVPLTFGDKEQMTGSLDQMETSYMDSRVRERENRSSAWALLVVGGVGLLGVVLGITGILPFSPGNPYLFYGVMSAVFLWFVIMGVISMKNARLFAKRAASEDSLRDAVLKWCKENLRAEDIDAALTENGLELPDGVIYFRRVGMLKDRINHQFMNLDQTLVEHFIDDQVYDMVFGEEDE